MKERGHASLAIRPRYMTIWERKSVYMCGGGEECAYVGSQKGAIEYIILKYKTSTEMAFTRRSKSE